MRKIKLNLMLVALVVGAMSAFAFNVPKPPVQLFGRVTAPNGTFIRWEAVSASYSCNAASGTCTAQLQNNDPMLGQPISGTETSGKYVP
ncbi:MAG TPA: hypothetical protein PK325_00980 [Cyclobacteriaceae bacterium]|nr:hypothetical protein [Cyclobacteriaceae bacterium]HMV08157.1 hypothetical protein [Cyclobacteriaceae bacterium]HMX00798.1 hypothetical protein [Cyclobacteriaceae bacterium]HMX49327.1 hypothetical protein [Cyclobacteriaceae bacterium]HMY93601.1 hypothetical protein [Cyclobacteriaceae bacterium]